VLAVFFDLQILAISLVSFGHVLSFFFDLRILVISFGIIWQLCFLSSLIEGFLLSLWYLRIKDTGYPYGILDLRILVIPLVS